MPLNRPESVSACRYSSAFVATSAAGVQAVAMQHAATSTAFLFMTSIVSRSGNSLQACRLGERHLKESHAEASPESGIGLMLALLASVAMADTQRWSPEKANAWYAKAALAGGQQLHSHRRHQPARNVAGGHLQPRADRQGARLGRSDRHEHHACVPARQALGAGRRGFQQAHRRVPDDRRPAQDQAAVRVLRLLLGSESEAGPAASADSRRAQLRLGAKPRQRGSRRHR